MAFVPYEAPVNPENYPYLSSILAAIGFLVMSKFFTMRIASKKTSGGLVMLAKELMIASIGSVFLGFGILFLALNVGIYV